ncbi:MAG: alpha-D-ribose 1-methylphosphonate 5-triphosphate diphosphatase, partial [Mangrovicoccus sp.]
MFDIRHSHSFTLTGAQLVTPEAVITGGLSVENGVITDLHEGRAEGLDLQGDYLIPGIVDVHTDHAETHVVPRAGVQWNFDAALMAHDGVVISGGTTTVFDSLSVGASMKKPERREILGPLVQALADGVAKGRFRAEHMLHMRCEICDPATIELVNQTIGLPITRLVSVMDHTPGDRQSPDIDSWMRAMARDMQIDLHTAQDMTDELLTRSARVGAEVRAHVISQALARDLPLMTHDDRSCEHVDQSSAEGITVSEFPCTHEAASRAR